MNEYQKEKIKEFRLKGMGYKAIANVLGLSRDSVRGFCRRNNLVGNKAVVALNMEVKLKKNEVCSCCKKTIRQKNKGRARKFCSSECDINGGMKILTKEIEARKQFTNTLVFIAAKSLLLMGIKAENTVVMIAT